MSFLPLTPIHFGVFTSQKLPDRPVLIEGILRAGSRMLLAATAKGHKTWTLMGLALCLASGITWLRFKCRKCKVLYANFELYEDTCQKRLNEVAAALGITPSSTNLHVINRRNKPIGLTDFCNQINTLFTEAEKTPEPFDILILDPIYKLYPKDMKENDACSVKEFLEHVSTAAEVRPRPVATAYSHHFAKGDQSKKYSKERASGSGTFQRDPDAILSFTEHQNDEILSISLTLREFPPQEDFVVKWNCPLLTLDEEGLSPKDIRRAPGAPQKFHRTQILPFLNGVWTPRKDLLAVILDKFEVSERTIDAKLKELVTMEIIERNDGKFRRLQQEVDVQLS